MGDEQIGKTRWPTREIIALPLNVLAVAFQTVTSTWRVTPDVERAGLVVRIAAIASLMACGSRPRVLWWVMRLGLGLYLLHLVAELLRG